MLPVRKAMPNLYAAAGVVPRHVRDKVVRFEAKLQGCGRRVEHNVLEDGQVLWRIVIPTPGKMKPEGAITLDQWKAFPRFAEPVAHTLSVCIEKRKS